VTAGRRPRGPRVRRLGIFGGTFDPPHVGHLALAEWAREELALDRVLFVPAGTPPHKAAARAGVAHRVAMTRRAVRGNPAFAVSTIEARRHGPSYTADTVTAIAEAHPGAELWLLMGADMYATFDTWVRPAEIAARAALAVALRPGAKAPRPSRFARRGRGVRWLANPALELSSSAVRERARDGLSLRYLVPDAVARYIEQLQLYGEAI
jgi:nicotinate-nucleotide adenylyltransferase